MSENETFVVAEPAKPSRLSRIKPAVITAAWIIIPTGLTIGGTYASYKMVGMQLEAAKLNLETAKLKQLP
jgi:hypothetical protein